MWERRDDPCRRKWKQSGHAGHQRDKAHRAAAEGRHSQIPCQPQGEKLAKARAAPEKPTGKQTVKQLIGQNHGVSNIEITDSNIKSFERVARKYGVDFAVKKDRSVSPPKYLVFFKGRDADALTAAFREYTAKEVKRASQDKPSVLEQLRALKAKVLSLTPDKSRSKDKGLEL